MPFVVQEAESALFLTSFQGDVGYTQWLHEAGRFDEVGEAMDTGNFMLGCPFHVTEVVS
jgi:hypothetical protein